MSASQDHDWHQPLTHCHCGRVIPCRHHDGAEGQDEECRPCCDTHPTQGCADVGCRHDCEGWIERFEEQMP